MAEPNRRFVIFSLALNICLSIVIVLINKWIYTHYGFPNITMTCLHFVCTTFGLLICERLGIFQAKKLPVMKMIPLSLTFCGFVVFTNLSLQTNTVGTYQLSKTMTTPCIIAIQSIFYSRRFSTKVKLTLVRMRRKNCLALPLGLALAGLALALPFAFGSARACPSPSGSGLVSNDCI